LHRTPKELFVKSGRRIDNLAGYVEPDQHDVVVREIGDIVDSALYVDGRRVASPATLSEVLAQLHEYPGALAWIGLYRPGDTQLAALAAEFGLHPLAIEDAIEAHQRPKLERFGDTLFVVVSCAQYLETQEEVEFSELHVFLGPKFVITGRHGEAPNLGLVRERLEDRPHQLALGPEAVLFTIFDRVVDDYGPVIAGLENDVLEIEREVFSGNPDVSRRIYFLTREVIDFQRATHALAEIIQELDFGFEKYRTDPDLQKYLRATGDHLQHIIDRTDEIRQLLRDMLTVNSTLVSQQQNQEMAALSHASNQQNEEVKKISAWAAIIFAPSLVGTVYGMNFVNMPELNWRYGYPMALGLMVATSVTLYLVFVRRGWL
jgi:magnesium transporter